MKSLLRFATCLLLPSVCLLPLYGLAQSQYASTVIAFSSQWSTTSWSAQQTLGAPNTTGCGDIATAWASATADGAREFLVLGFTTPQPVSRININETWNPGAIDTVYLRNASTGVWNIVYTATASPATPCPRMFGITITTTSFNVDAIRIAINSPAISSWNEIDAVEIINCTATIQSSNLLCNNVCTGTAMAFSSGTGPYNYIWAPNGETTQTISNLCAGSYTVNVTDVGGCSASATVTITEPPVLSVTVTNNNPFVCPSTCNAILTANPAGGTPPYSYQWSPGGQTTQTTSGNCAGTYTVCVTDANGCTTCTTATISIYNPIITISAPPQCCGSCCNGTATATISGGCGPFTYTWNPTFQTTSTATGLCEGTYLLTVVDQCCGTNHFQSVNIVPSITLSTSTTPASCANCCDGTMTVTPSGGNPGYTYLWTPGNYTTQTVTGLCPGTYTVCVTDAQGCYNCSTVTVNYTIGQNEFSEEDPFFSVYPNPGKNNFNLACTGISGELAVRISDISGQLLYESRCTLSAFTQSVSLGFIPPENGIYVVEVIAGNRRENLRLVVIN